MQILFNQTFVGVNHQHHNISVINCLEGFNNGEFLNRQFNIFAFANTGGVDQRVLFAVTFVIDINAVASGASFIKNHHAVFTEQAIDQGGFAHVGTTNDADSNTI